MRMYQLLTYLVLAIILFIPAQLSRAVFVGVFIFGVVLLPLVAGQMRQFFQRWRTIGNLRETPFVAFLIWTASTTATSVAFGRSMAALLVLLVCFITYNLIGTVFASLQDRERLSMVFIWLTVILSIIGLYHTIVLHYVNFEGNGVSFYWNYFGHNHLSALQIFAIPLAIYFAVQSRQKRTKLVIWLAGLYILVISFLFTFARYSLVALILASPLFFWQFFRPASKKTTFGLVAILLICFGAFTWFTFSQGSGFGVLKNDTSLQSRLIYWNIGWQNFLSHPIFGTGPDTYSKAYANYGSQLVPATNYSHNFLIQWLSDSGAIGFGLGILLLGSFFLRSVHLAFHGDRNKQLFYTALLTGLVASTINALGDFDWQLPTVLLVFWFFAGLVTTPESLKS